MMRNTTINLQKSFAEHRRPAGTSTAEHRKFFKTFIADALAFEYTWLGTDKKKALNVYTLFSTYLFGIAF